MAIGLSIGKYLIRIEHIALHIAQSYGAAQYYISCAQVQVSIQEKYICGS